MAAILLIHDDELMRIATRMMLQRDGHQVHDTQDGAGGLAHFRRLGADLVIAKAGMSASASRSIGESVREADQNVPILLTCPPDGTGSGVEREAKQVRARLVSSPFSAADLTAHVDRLLGALPG